LIYQVLTDMHSLPRQVVEQLWYFYLQSSPLVFFVKKSSSLDFR
jgi:hypothetical protein